MGELLKALGNQISRNWTRCQLQRRMRHNCWRHWDWVILVCIVAWRGVCFSGESMWIRVVVKSATHLDYADGARTRNLWRFCGISPLSLRRKNMYGTRYLSNMMMWWAKNRFSDYAMCFPANAPAWKHLDSSYPSFGEEDRNVRLLISIHGVNLFSFKSAN